MKVLDLSHDVAGRFGAKLFAQGGDEVVRLDTPKDDTDALGIYLDCEKTILDASHLPALLAQCDLIWTSFDRGKWLGLADGLAVPETCVRVTTSSFGSRGPYASWRGGPLADWAAGGYLFITGDPDREPLSGPENLCAYAAGYTAAAGAEAALVDRLRTGRGRHLDISTMETMLILHQSTFSRTAAGELRRRTGRYTEVYPLTVLPCRDGHVSIGVVTDAEFDKLAIAIGRPELTADSRFGSLQARWAHCDDLDRELASYLGLHEADAIVATLQAGGVACAKVEGPLSVTGNPQLKHRGFWQAEPGGGVMPGDALAHSHALAPGNGARTALGRPGKLPLEGVRVLDFTIFWAGPSATRTLADLGADVIWVERPNARLDCHVAPGETPTPHELQLHLYDTKMFRGKRSIALDLKNPQDLAIARELAGKAHIVVENFRPGVADALGIGPRDLARLNPALTYVSLSGWGSEGPWAEWRSYGPSIEAASSIQGRTGYRNGEPLRLGHTLPDGTGGLIGTVAALRGLRQSLGTGIGRWFDISQLEAYAAMAGEEIIQASRAGREPPLAGNRSDSAMFQGVFPCRGTDQWIAIRLRDAKDCARFAQASGIDVTAQGAPDNAERAVADSTARYDKASLAHDLQAAGLEAFAVLSAHDLTVDEHLAARAFLVDVPAGDAVFPMPGSPFVADPPMADASRPAPRPGADTQAVISSLTARLAPG